MFIEGITSCLQKQNLHIGGKLYAGECEEIIIITFNYEPFFKNKFTKCFTDITF